MRIHQPSEPVCDHNERALLVSATSSYRFRINFILIIMPCDKHLVFWNLHLIRIFGSSKVVIPSKISPRYSEEIPRRELAFR